MKKKGWIGGKIATKLQNLLWRYYYPPPQYKQQTSRNDNNIPKYRSQIWTKNFYILDMERAQLSFANKQPPKKKRKSRTAFTNHQIFELEKRFLYQKYLSPADRDEIAATLGLSNAQVNILSIFSSKGRLYHLSPWHCLKNSNIADRWSRSMRLHFWLD